MLLNCSHVVLSRDIQFENRLSDNVVGIVPPKETPVKFEQLLKAPSPSSVTRENGTLVMATNAAFEPYEYMENGEIVGFDVDMARAICDILGMELKIENIEFDSIINAVQSGKADVGIAGMTVTADRLKSIDFIEFLMVEHTGLEPVYVCSPVNKKP